MTLRLAALAALLAGPFAGPLGAQDGSALPLGLWLPAAVVESYERARLLDGAGNPIAVPGFDPVDMVADACIGRGYGIFPGGVWHPLALDGGAVEWGALCQTAGEGKALCEVMATDVVRAALAPAATPDPALFYALHWTREDPDQITLCTSDFCEPYASCLPLLEDWAGDDPAGRTEVERVRARLQDPIPLIEAGGIDLAARAAEAGVSLRSPQDSDGGRVERR